MPEYKLIKAVDDWQRYMDIYNRHTQFAPYTIPLTMDLIESRIMKTYDENDQLALICGSPDGGGEGLIHVKHYKPDSGHDAGKEMGLIHLLLGDSSNAAEYLLREAEKWCAARKLKEIRVCNWRPNPYMFMLFGSEIYVWGGHMAAINAYRRLNYDYTLESVIMMCDMYAEPIVPVLDIEGLDLRETEIIDDELVYRSCIKASINGNEIGKCTYDYLKAISSHFKKPIGQISIGLSQDTYYGKGIGQALLLSAHNRLYKMGARKVMLHTAQFLFRAIKMYEKIGYKHQNIRGYVFEKELTNTYNDDAGLLNKSAGIWKDKPETADKDLQHRYEYIGEPPARQC